MQKARTTAGSEMVQETGSGSGNGNGAGRQWWCAAGRHRHGGRHGAGMAGSQAWTRQKGGQGGVLFLFLLTNSTVSVSREREKSPSPLPSTNVKVSPLQVPLLHLRFEMLFMNALKEKVLCMWLQWQKPGVCSSQVQVPSAGGKCGRGQARQGEGQRAWPACPGRRGLGLNREQVMG